MLARSNPAVQGTLGFTSLADTLSLLDYDYDAFIEDSINTKE